MAHRRLSGVAVAEGLQGAARTPVGTLEVTPVTQASSHELGHILSLEHETGVDGTPYLTSPCDAKTPKDERHLMCASAVGGYVLPPSNCTTLRKEAAAWAKKYAETYPGRPL